MLNTVCQRHIKDLRPNGDKKVSMTTRKRESMYAEHSLSKTHQGFQECASLKGDKKVDVYTDRSKVKATQRRMCVKAVEKPRL